MPSDQEREQEALEQPEGDVMVPLVTGEDTPTGWAFTGPFGWLAERVKRWVK